MNGTDMLPADTSGNPGATAAPAARPRRAAAHAAALARAMWRHGGGRYALTVLGLWAAVSLVCLVWTPQPLLATDGYHTWAAPSASHLLGTDGTGADVLSWLMAGSGTDLAIVALTVLAAGAFGLLLVAAMVSRRTALAQTALVAVDALIALPTVLLALLLAVPFGASVAVVVGACGFVYGLNLARVARPAALLAARSGYVEAALARGASGPGTFLRHVVPNIAPVLAVQLSTSAGTAVLAEAGLTYLGVGVPSGTPSWGHSLATSADLVTVHPLTVVWPGLTVTAVVVALNLFGDALRRAIGEVDDGR